ncbi:P-type DNA transfer protein VirB5 [Halopseudomonas pelagia]|uniref:P-type DNA transfer protein VirB5 n=1 Tax=Halopseudomonas pelagia TaxID=553151 RepID=UPI00039DBADF|nr:P-type DNA transfer protein VirB5 [Halopseudomonas pelagia]
MKYPKAFPAITFACSVLLSGHASAQIPVTDVALNGQTTANQAATMAQWAQQLVEMKNQYDQMQRDYAALTGSRGLGTIMNDPSLRDYLPNDWQGVYDSVKSQGYSGLSGTAATVYNQNRIYDSCAHISMADQRTLCEARAVKASQDKGFALDAYNAAKGRLIQIDQLMGQINATDDPKSIAELQGRIQAEQAMIQNEQTKLQLYDMVAQAEDRIQQQQQIELNAESHARRGWLQPQIAE